MEDFDKLVIDFIGEYGFLASYEKHGSPTYDPSAGTVVDSKSSIQVNILVQELSGIHNGLSLKFGTTIQAGDKEVFMQPPVKSNPANDVLEIDLASDRLVIGSTSYRIVAVKEMSSHNSNVYVYDMLVRM